VWGAVQRVLQVLFDLSFASFITARVVKTIYLLAIIFMVLYVLSTVGWLFFSPTPSLPASRNQRLRA